MAPRRSMVGVAVVMLLGMAFLTEPARAAEQVGTAFPPDFPAILDASLGVPVIGFGAAGKVKRTPVIFLHGNNDTPFPTACNPSADPRDGPVLPGPRVRGERAVGPRLPGRPVRSRGEPDQPLRRGALHGGQHPRPAALRARRARLHRRPAGRHRRAQPRRPAGPRLAAHRPRLPPGASLRGHRRSQPRHHQLLAVTAELLSAPDPGRLHARQRHLPASMAPTTPRCCGSSTMETTRPDRRATSSSATPTPASCTSRSRTVCSRRCRPRTGRATRTISRRAHGCGARAS